MTGNQTPQRHEEELNQAQEDASSTSGNEAAPLYDSFSESLDGRDPSAAQTLHTEDPRIAQYTTEIQLLKDQLMRALAETENTRKRSIREREDASRFAIAGFAKDLVNVADNLRRALEAVPAELLAQTPQIKNLTDGIEATERELLRSFEKNGIQSLNPLDQPFDPNFHEVMFEAPIPDKPSGTVIQVIETGYTISGRLLRPARVGVSKDGGAAQTPPRPSGHTIDTQA